MEWIDYSAGSHISLFDGSLYVWLTHERICSVRHRPKWQAITYLDSREDGGICVIGEGKSREEVKKKAEKWLLNKTTDLLKKLL